MALTVHDWCEFSIVALLQARNSGTPQYPPAAQRQPCSTLSSQQHIKSAVPSAAGIASQVDGRRVMSNEQHIQMQLQQLYKEKQRILRDQEAILIKVSNFYALSYLWWVRGWCHRYVRMYVCLCVSRRAARRAVATQLITQLLFLAHL